MMESLSINVRTQLEDNIKLIKEKVANAAVRSGRNPEDVEILAVTKTIEPLLINHAIACGLTHIGENRVQEFLQKKPDLHLEGVTVDLIGRLQSNKVRKIVGQVRLIESVDSVNLAGEINRISKEMGIISDCLIEVNIGGEESKSGAAPQYLGDLLDEISHFDHIHVRGLMTIPPICDNSTRIRTYFSNMHQIFIDIKQKKLDNVNMDFLSMGMSADFEEAILEGANIIRPGTALFGIRTS